MSTATPTAKPVSIRWRMVYLVVGIVLALVGVGIVQQWRGGGNAHELAALVADLDSRDPGWRLEELEAAREAIPEAENSAPVIVKLAARFPRNWPDYNALNPAEGTLANRRLDDDRRARLRAEMVSVAGLLVEARQLIKMPCGRHELILNKSNPAMIVLEEQQRTRRVASLLQLAATDLAHEGKVTEAIRSAHAALNTSRAIGDEPVMIAQIIRIGCFQSAADAIERSLALGECAEKELADLQAVLILDEQHNGYLCATRGERATIHAMLTGLSKGEVRLHDLAVGSMSNSTRLRCTLIPGGIRRTADREHPAILGLTDEAVSVAHLPIHARQKDEGNLESSYHKLSRQTELARVLLRGFYSNAQTFRRKVALNRSLIVLVAVERYRLKYGTWPESLDALKPDLLKEIPRDPCDGKPLRYLQHPDGVAVYSVGVDCFDNHGHIDRTRPMNKGADLGYRLWDVASRNQPAVGAKK